VNKRILLTKKADCARAAVWLQAMQIDPAEPMELVLQKHEPAKTNSQRRLFHAICRDIGLQLGHAPGAVKAAVKADYFGVESYTIAGKPYARVASSEEPGRHEYSQLIEFALMWGAERGAYVEVST
jgi:hypothetical protein